MRYCDGPFMVSERRSCQIHGTMEFAVAMVILTERTLLLGSKAFEMIPRMADVEQGLAGEDLSPSGDVLPESLIIGST